MTLRGWTYGGYAGGAGRVRRRRSGFWRGRGGGGVAVAFVEDFDNPDRRNARHLVKQRLGKLGLVSAERLDPRLVVQRHGVGDCPVAVEDEASDVGRNLDEGRVGRRGGHRRRL